MSSAPIVLVVKGEGDNALRNLNPRALSLSPTFKKRLAIALCVVCKLIDLVGTVAHQASYNRYIIQFLLEKPIMIEFWCAQYCNILAENGPQINDHQSNSTRYLLKDTKKLRIEQI